MTLTPYIKPHTTYRPDYFSRETDAWLIFPYDIRETYDNFVKEFQSKQKAHKKMKEIGFEDWELRAIL